MTALSWLPPAQPQCSGSIDCRIGRSSNEISVRAVVSAIYGRRTDKVLLLEPSRLATGERKTILFNRLLDRVQYSGLVLPCNRLCGHFVANVAHLIGQCVQFIFFNHE